MKRSGDLGVTWLQRSILIIAALLLLLFAFSNATGSFETHPTLATVQFVIAFLFLVLAARPRS